MAAVLAIFSIGGCTHLPNTSDVNFRVTIQDTTVARSEQLFSERFASSLRRNLRMASGLILFTYIGAHLLNHSLGLISLGAAEAGMEYAVEVWYSLPGTILL